MNEFYLALHNFKAYNTVRLEMHGKLFDIIKKYKPTLNRIAFYTQSEYTSYCTFDGELQQLSIPEILETVVVQECEYSYIQHEEAVGQLYTHAYMSVLDNLCNLYYITDEYDRILLPSGMYYDSDEGITFYGSFGKEIDDMYDPGNSIEFFCQLTHMTLHLRQPTKDKL